MKRKRKKIKKRSKTIIMKENNESEPRKITEVPIKREKGRKKNICFQSVGFEYA